MRQNPSFAMTDVAELRRIIAAHPWATLVGRDESGMTASHYAVLLDPDRDDLTIVAHVGRPDDLVLGLGTQESRQRQPANAERTDPEEVASRETIAVPRTRARDGEHVHSEGAPLAERGRQVPAFYNVYDWIHNEKLAAAGSPGCIR